MDNRKADFEYGMKEAVREAEMILRQGREESGHEHTDCKEYLAMFEVLGDEIRIVALAEDRTGKVLVHIPDDARIRTDKIAGQYGLDFTGSKLFADAVCAENTVEIRHKSEALLNFPRRDEVLFYTNLCSEEVLGILKFFRDGLYVVMIYE